MSSVDPEYIYFCEKLERRNVHGNIEYWLRLTGVNIFRTQRWLKEYAVQVSKLSLRRLVWQRPIFNHEQKLPSRENRFNVCVKLPTLFERISILTFWNKTKLLEEFWITPTLQKLCRTDTLTSSLLLFSYEFHTTSIK